MRRPLAFAALAFLFLLPISILAQQGQQAPPTRDQQATDILFHCLQVSGGAPAIEAILDFKATGGVTYYWAGEEVTGTATVKGRGTDQFRMDSALSSGDYSVFVNKWSGEERDIRGKTTPIKFPNAVNKGNLIFPMAEIASRLRDGAVGLSYVGMATIDGHQVHQIRTQRFLAPDAGPGKLLNKQTTRDFFIDPQTFYVVATSDTLHSADVDRGGVEIPHQMRFSDYRAINGVLVPFSISERIAGQTTWTIQLSAISFNAGLSETDFQR